MPIKTVERVIGENNYSCTQFDAITGLQLSARLGCLLLEAGGGLADGDFTGAARALVDQLQSGKTDAAKLCQDLCVKIEVNGKKLEGEHSFPFWFAGMYGELMKVILFVVEVNNFSDFFSGLAPYKSAFLGALMVRLLGAGAMAEAMKDQTSQKDLKSDGGSGSSGSAETKPLTKSQADGVSPT